MNDISITELVGALLDGLENRHKVKLQEDIFVGRNISPFGLYTVRAHGVNSHFAYPKDAAEHILKLLASEALNESEKKSLPEGAQTYQSSWERKDFGFFSGSNAAEPTAIKDLSETNPPSTLLILASEAIDRVESETDPIVRSNDFDLWKSLLETERQVFSHDAYSLRGSLLVILREVTRHRDVVDFDKEAIAAFRESTNILLLPSFSQASSARLAASVSVLSRFGIADCGPYFWR